MEEQVLKSEKKYSSNTNNANHELVQKFFIFKWNETGSYGMYPTYYKTCTKSNNFGKLRLIKLYHILRFKH